MKATAGRVLIVPLTLGLLLAAGWQTTVRSAPRSGSPATSWQQTLAERIP
jgi:hypothetical protein